MSGLRCFVGIPLSDALREALVRSCGAIRDADPRWRGDKWVAEENMHVTVKFLGNVDEERLGILAERVGAEVSALAPFVLPVAPVRAVPNPRRCRMLWASFVDPDGSCAALAAAVEGAVLEFGIGPEERPFVPHATLCRARAPKPLTAEALEAAQRPLDAAPDSMSVPSATLFSSRLTPRGPIYAEVATWGLEGGNP